MPLSVVKRLILGELTPTTMFLQMANMSMTQLEVILEDVLVKVGKFIFPVDFMVIDMEEDKQVPLLLGRPFLATGAALIDLKKGELTLRVGTEELHFNLNQSLKQPNFESAKCMRIDNVIPDCPEINNNFLNENPLEECIFKLLYNEDLEKKGLNVEEEVIETVLSLSEGSNAESLSSSEMKV